MTKVQESPAYAYRQAVLEHGSPPILPTNIQVGSFLKRARQHVHKWILEPAVMTLRVPMLDDIDGELYVLHGKYRVEREIPPKPCADCQVAPCQVENPDNWFACICHEALPTIIPAGIYPNPERGNIRGKCSRDGCHEVRTFHPFAEYDFEDGLS